MLPPTDDTQNKASALYRGFATYKRSLKASIARLQVTINTIRQHQDKHKWANMQASVLDGQQLALFQLVHAADIDTCTHQCLTS
jgi:hypothetical protein